MAKSYKISLDDEIHQWNNSPQPGDFNIERPLQSQQQ